MRAPPHSLRLHTLGTLLAAACCVAWLNPSRDRIADGNRLFKQGKFDDAIGKYGEALVDDPDSPLLNFNMGDANYKAGKYAEALASYARVRGDDDAPRAAKTAYNTGNAQYRLGAAAEAEKPQDALAAYAAALAAYRRALGADPTDQDIKFNYEFVSKKIEDLKKKLEEQKQQQEQQQKDQPEQSEQQKDQQQQQPGEQDQNQQRAEPDKPHQPDEPNKEEQQPQPASQKSDQQNKAEEQQAAAPGAAGKHPKDQMSPQEAASLIDTARNEELRPDEFARQVQGATVAEPAQDW